MFKHIIDSEVELRLLQEKDAVEMLALIDSERGHLRKWLPWVDSTTTMEDSKGFIDFTRKQFASNNGFQCGIWYKGSLAGVIGYHGVNWSNRTTSIGYWLGNKFTGKGIMTRACKALVTHALVEEELNRVEIRCSEGNLKSRAIPERLGFKKEGIVRECEWLYDHFESHVVYGMLRSELIENK